MARRGLRFGRQVPYLTERQIEDHAAQLLAEYGREQGEATTPPIPIDEIVEIHLKLGLEFKDLQQLFGFGDIHGAIWINRRLIGVDLRLDPTTNKAGLGRYRFTLAHETGHWQLHRQLYQHRADQPTFPDAAEQADYVCRSSDRSPVEWQANCFASCLLMPREMVKQAWQQWRGALEPVYLDELRAGNSDSGSAGTQNDRDEADDLLERFSRPLASQFHVSAEAMRIRLEDLQLLLRKRARTLFD